MTTLKATITFEVSEKHLEALSNIQSKDVQELTQEDLLDLRTVLQKSLVWEAHKDENKTYKEVFKALANMVGNERLFRPMDQRSLPEFAMYHLLKWVDSWNDASEKIIVINETGELFYKALGNDYTVSLNDTQAQNYIRAFWEDFIEEDCEDWDAEQIFKHPAAFLDQQVGLMAIRLIKAVFENSYNELGDDYYTSLVDFKHVVAQMSASDLWDLVD